MLENGLFLFLGFLCAAFLAMMLAPAIWRRAVALTQQRIESSVPLTLNEIQADKDQMRAEFAMKIRKLEMQLEEETNRANEQFIEISRRRDETHDLEKKEAKNDSRISDLEIQTVELRASLAQREQKLNEISLARSALQAKLTERNLAFEELDYQYQTSADDFDEQKIELVARGTKLATVKDELQSAKKTIKAQNTKHKKLTDTNKALTISIEKEEKRNAKLEDKLTRLQGQLADMDDRLKRRDLDLKNLRSKSGDSGKDVMDLHKQLDQANAKSVELEAKLNEAANEKADTAAKFNENRKQFRKEIRVLKKERDGFQIQLGADSGGDGGDKNNTKLENAEVRKRISELAAQVTAMTAAQEGSSSPINKALKSSNGSSDKKNGKIDTETDSVGEIMSLADRIKALQAAVD